MATTAVNAAADNSAALLRGPCGQQRLCGHTDSPDNSLHEGLADTARVAVLHSQGLAMHACQLVATSMVVAPGVYCTAYGQLIIIGS